jgi:hypothetical protein
MNCDEDRCNFAENVMQVLAKIVEISMVTNAELKIEIY